MTQIVTGSPRVKTDYRTHSRNVRFRIPYTNQYLHLSGEGQTTGTAYAWIGTREQARVIRDRALARGDDWPYRAIAPKAPKENDVFEVPE